MEKTIYSQEIQKRLGERIMTHFGGTKRAVNILIGATIIGNILFFIISYFVWGIKTATQNIITGLGLSVTVEVLILVGFWYSWRHHDIPEEIYEEQIIDLKRMKEEQASWETYKKMEEKIRQANGISFEGDLIDDNKKVGIKVINQDNEVFLVEIILHKVDGEDLDIPETITNTRNPGRDIKVGIPTTYDLFTLRPEYAISPQGVQLNNGKHTIVTQVGGIVTYTEIYRREITWEVTVDADKQELSIIKLEENKLFGNTEGDNE